MKTVSYTHLIKGDNDLFIAIQESIEQALRDAGIDNAAHGAMKDAVVKYLSDEYNKQYFNGLVTGPYASLFGGSDADKIIKDLQEYTELSLIHISLNFSHSSTVTSPKVHLPPTNFSKWL